VNSQAELETQLLRMFDHSYLQAGGHYASGTDLERRSVLTLDTTT
jgi:hypothetical protein